MYDSALQLIMAFLIPCILLAVVPTMIAVQIRIDPIIVGQDLCHSSQQRNAVHDMLHEQFYSKVHTIEQCGEGLWYKVLSVNMSDANSQCPDGWVEENVGGVRACGRGTVGGGCRSVYIPSNISEYTKVCGRAIGYQYGHTDAFGASRVDGLDSVDQTYVDGLSITYGSPRQHIWTYAAGVREGGYTASSNCPCSNYPGAQPPSFVGNNWYCESGNPTLNHPLTIWSSDPLWDGEQCEGTCCSNGKSPPWFSVELPHSTNANIEARICSNEHSDNQEDVFIEMFELYAH